MAPMKPTYANAVSNHPVPGDCARCLTGLLTATASYPFCTSVLIASRNWSMYARMLSSIGWV
jgi:hypothetical protein